MKTILSLLVVAMLAGVGGGCAAKTTVGNRDQHGAGFSARTRGTDPGVHARVY